jgi:hypothetical protein
MGLEDHARQISGDELAKWRISTSVDHLNYLTMDKKDFPFSLKNPYGTPVNAARILTEKIDSLENSITHNFHILERSKKYAILICSPEVGEVPEQMGQLSQLYMTIRWLGLSISSMLKGLWR